MKIRIKVTGNRSKKYSLSKKNVVYAELKLHKHSYRTRYPKRFLSRGGDCTEKNKDNEVDFPPD